jgi:hypothetical protein
MRVVWASDVERRLRSFPTSDEAAIRGAVQRFASGPDVDPAEGSLMRRLRVVGHVVLMVLDPDGRTVRVVRLFRAERR